MTIAGITSAIGDRIDRIVNELHAGVQDVITQFRSVPRPTYERVVRWVVAVAALVVIGVLGLIAFLIYYPRTQIPHFTHVQNVIYLDQGDKWEPTREAENRQTFYYTPQGTSLKGLRYSWFINLEQPWSRAKFVDPNHLRAYGFWVDMAPTPKNPDLLPVGFAKRFDPAVNDYVLDITCAACHTGQINYSNAGLEYAIRIDGGAAMHAFTAAKYGHFAPMLLSSVAETFLNPFKFQRFARRVLGDRYYDRRNILHSQIGGLLADMLQQAWSDRKLYPVEEGFGRTDAVGRISNAVFGDHLTPANYRPGNAPVSYPPVWEITNFDWVQYTASVSQPLARNLGEAMGVGSTFHLVDEFDRPTAEAQRYITSADVANLVKIEDAVRALKPPKWPEHYLGALDWCKAKKGRALFVERCQGCHGPHPLDPYMAAANSPGKLCRDGRIPCIPTSDEIANGLPEWEMKTVPVEDIGTDPQAAMNFANVRVSLRKTGVSSKEIANLLRPVHEDWYRRQTAAYQAALEHWGVVLQARGIQPGSPKDQALRQKFESYLADYKQNWKQYVDQALDTIDMDHVSIGGGLNFLGVMIRDVYYRQNNTTPQMQAQMNGYGALDLPQVLAAYKARPLAGMWATPPFLHNGSVPSLYDLLGPASQRPKTFFVGRKLFDPVRVGYRQEPLSGGGFWLDTSIAGNHNTGHEFRDGYVPFNPASPQPMYGVIGPAFSDEERMAVVEYLKIHDDTKDAVADHEKSSSTKDACAATGSTI